MFLVGIAKYRHFSVQIVEIIFSRCAASFKRTHLLVVLIILISKINLKPC
jgi:hypothetical protein